MRWSQQENTIDWSARDPQSGRSGGSHDLISFIFVFVFFHGSFLYFFLSFFSRLLFTEFDRSRGRKRTDFFGMCHVSCPQMNIFMVRILMDEKSSTHSSPFCLYIYIYDQLLTTSCRSHCALYQWGCLICKGSKIELYHKRALQFFQDKRAS